MQEFISDTPKVDQGEFIHLLDEIKHLDIPRDSVHKHDQCDDDPQVHAGGYKIETKNNLSISEKENVTPKKQNFTRQYSKELDQTPAVSHPSTHMHDHGDRSHTVYTDDGIDSSINQLNFDDDHKGEVEMPNLDNIDIENTLLFDLSPIIPSLAVFVKPSGHRMAHKGLRDLLKSTASEEEEYELIQDFAHLDSTPSRAFSSPRRILQQSLDTATINY